MRVAAILGPRASSKHLHPFRQLPRVTWLPAVSGDADAILIFGGDGTVHRHLADLVKLQRPVLVVPCGSGNDFARALGLRKFRDSLAAFRQFIADQSNVRAIDLGVIRSGENTQHYFCTVGGVGLDSEVARLANGLPRWMRGNGGYALVLPPALFKYRPASMRIDAFGRPATPPQLIFLAAFANAPAYGGGMKIAPKALLDDGQLDICLIHEVDKLKLFCLFPTVYFGRHLNVAEVEYFQTEGVTVETETPHEVYADGEFVCRTPVDVRVSPTALRVIAGPY